MEQAYQSKEYAELAEQVITEHEDLHWIREAGIGIGYLSSDKEKKSKGRVTFGECVKVKDLYKAYIPHDFVIVIYEPNTQELTEEQLKILLYHELLHVDAVEVKGQLVCKTKQHDLFLEEFQAVADRYGTDWARTD